MPHVMFVTYSHSVAKAGPVTGSRMRCVEDRATAMDAYASAGSFRSKLEEPAPNGDGHSMRAIVRIELEKNASNVALHGVIADVKPVSDDLVRASGCDLLQDFDLALRQSGTGSVLRNLKLHFGEDPTLSRMDCAHRRKKIATKCGFEKITPCSGSQSPHRLNVTLVGRQDNDLRFWMRFANHTDHFNPADVRQPKIQERDIGPDRLVKPNRLLPRFSRTREDHVGLAPNHRRQSLLQDRVVINNQDGYLMDRCSFGHQVSFQRVSISGHSIREKRLKIMPTPPSVYRSTGRANLVRRFLSATLLLAVLFTLPPFTAVCQEQKLAQMLHRGWTAKDGAPQDIKAMVQARDGTLWIGTAGGLYNFDGLAFTQFKPAPGDPDLQSNSIKSLLMAQDGALWVGMRQGGAARIVNGRITTAWTTYKKQPIVLVANLRQDALGRVWACVHNTYIAELLPDGEFRLDRTLPEGMSAGVKGFFFDSSGAMWALDNKRVVKRPYGSKDWIETEVKGDNFVSVEERPDHTFWLVDTDGDKHQGRRQHFDASGKLLSTAYDVHTAYATFALNDGLSLVERQDGITVERWEDGKPDVEIRSHGPVDTFKKVDGLTGNIPFAMLRDKSGNLWVGTDLGVDRFVPATIVKFITPDTDGGHLLCANQTSTWITSFNGPIYSVTENIAKKLSDATDTHFIHCGFDGDVWIVDHRGLFNVGSGRLVKTSPFPGWESFGIGSFAQFKKGSLIAGSRTQGAYELNGDKWSPFVPQGDFPKTAWTMLADAPRLWVANQSNLYLVENNVSRILATLPSDLGAIEVLARTSHGIMFAATNGVGIIHGDKMHLLPFTNVALARGGSGLVESLDHDVWVNGAKGIVRIPSNQIDEILRGTRKTIDAQNVTEGDFVGPASLTEHNPSAAIDRDGRLWFITINGAVSLNPADLKRRKPDTQLSVLSITGDGESLDESHTFHPRLKNLQIRYRGVNLTHPEATTYRYRLDGVDEAWQDAGSRTIAIYTELKPAKYVFRVQASSGDGIWTEAVASTPFTVKAAYYQTKWFYALCALATCFAIWLLLMLRMHYLAVAIERNAEHRADERVRIARELHDTLLQGVSGLLLSFHVAAGKVAPDHDSRDLLERSLMRADQILIEGRNRVNDLRADQVRDEELLDCLRNVASDLKDGHQVTWQVTRGGEDRVLRTTIADESFHILREAMTNAFRHAEATEVIVTLTYGRKQCIMSCRDNGRGFNFDAALLAKGHWGLRGMKERSLRIGADLSVASTVGQGSVIAITVPAWRAYRNPSWLPLIIARLRTLSGGRGFHGRTDD